MNLSQIQRDIFMKNAMLRGEGLTGGKKARKKRAPAKKKAPAKKMVAGITIGGAKKRKAPAKKGGKKTLPQGARNWLNLVKEVYASGNMSWKEALVAASKIYRKM